MKAIVVSPHPDDETLGACGTVRKLISSGHEVTWLNITNMRTEYGYSNDRVEERKEEMRKVNEATGFCSFYDLGLRPAALEQAARDDIISSIKSIFDEVRPEWVFLPFPYDAHSDHRVVYDCALACTKTFRMPFVRKVFCMDIISETNYATRSFEPNCYVDISGFIEDKINIMKYYKTEIKAPPFPRSEETIIAQARYRGAACYANYAEAFRIIKEVIL